MARLQDKVAIVTGAAQGIGSTFAIALAEEGARVAAADIADTDTTVNTIKQAGGSAIGLNVDVSDSASVDRMVADVVTEFGHVDILVNNAAIFASLRLKHFTQIPEDEWDDVMRVNIKGPFLCAKAVAPVMTERKSGKIINISSGVIFKGAPMFLHYVASKGAIFAMTRSLSRELGDANICVNAIAPGFTESEGVQANSDYEGPVREFSLTTRALKRPQYPDDLVGTLKYLASADSDFVTGQTILVDGGSLNH